MTKMFFIRIAVLLCILSWNANCLACKTDFNDVRIVSTKEQSKVIKIYPSAVGNLLKITFHDVQSEVAILQLKDKSGKIIFKKNINRGVLSIQVDISNFDNGTYSLSMTGNHTNETLEFIKTGN